MNGSKCKPFHGILLSHKLDNSLVESGLVLQVISQFYYGLSRALLRLDTFNFSPNRCNFPEMHTPSMTNSEVFQFQESYGAVEGFITESVDCHTCPLKATSNVCIWSNEFTTFGAWAHREMVDACDNV